MLDHITILDMGPDCRVGLQYHFLCISSMMYLPLNDATQIGVKCLYREFPVAGGDPAA